MKKIILSIVVIIFTFSNCFKDDSLNYKIPKFSIEDYYNFLGSSHDYILEKYPYALYESSENIKSYLKGDSEGIPLITRFHFNKDNICNQISFYERWKQEKIERFLNLANIINEFSTNLESITLIIADGDHYENIEINTIQEFINWKDTHSLKYRTILTLKWNGSDNKTNYTNNYRIDLRFQTMYMESNRKDFTIFFNIYKS